MNLILLISNDAAVSGELQKLIKKDTALVAVGDEEEALEVLRKEPVSLVLLYGNTANTAVLESVRRIREFGRGLTVMVMTAEAAKSEFIQEAIETGAYDWISRSSAAAEIRQAIEKAIEHQRLTEELSVLRYRDLNQGQSDHYPPAADLNGRYPQPKGGERGVYYRGGYFYLETLKRLSKALTQIFDLNQLCDLILVTVVDIFGITRGSLILRDEETGNYHFRAAVGLSERITESIKFTPEDVLIRWLAGNLQILKWETVVTNLRLQEFAQLKREMEIIDARIIIPLISRGRLVGALNLNNKLSGAGFSVDELELLTVIADYGAVAIENALLYREIDFQRQYTGDILENMTSGVVAVDKEGRITTLNQAAAKILGLTAEEVAGKDVYILDKKLAEIIDVCLRKGKTCDRQEVGLIQGNVLLGVSSSRVRDEEDKVIGAIAIFADLSRRRLLENEVKRLERLTFWSRLAIRMAQEIKNPLVPIRTFTQLLPQKYQDPEFRKDFYEVVSGEVNRLNTLIEQLISFAHPSRPEYRYCDLKPLIQKALSLLDEQIKEQEVRIEQKLDAGLPRVSVDEGQIEQAFYHLLLNGVQAMPNGGELSITVKLRRDSKPAPFDKEKGDMLEIEFKDTGVGIPAENLERVFAPFFTTKIKGAGLGLAIAQRNIEEHQGRIEVVSTEGKGSTFRVLLPVERAETESKDEARGREAGPVAET